MKILTLLVWLSLLFAGIGLLFWYNEYRYSLPTPVPLSYKKVPAGMAISLPPNSGIRENRPVFLHFFNPDCPCSRFNITHFKTLYNQFQGEVSFEIVVMNNTRYTEKEIQDKFGIDLPVSFDTALATACGVYSTPQAVILDADHQLYYRGNYNKNRYCTDKKTSYAQMALNALLRRGPTIVFDQNALTAYGCQLPESNP